MLECEVQYKAVSSEEAPKEEVPFVPGDAFGIYSSNLLVDVHQVLVSVMVSTSSDGSDSILLWDYLKVTKKQVFITLSDKVISYSLLYYY